MSKDKKVDPGWNDPPMLNYTTSNPPPKSRITNKRVAFPIASNSSQGSPLNVNAPPPMGSVVPPPVAFVNINKLIDENSGNDTVKMHLELIKNMWQQGQFTDDVKVLISDLVLSVCEKNAAKANEMLLKLSTGHSDISNQWIESIKQLINNM
ncbi:unnamed protein product [Brassicogethes aeneus]|uniref:Uncharacterized protein n=1 Tax=Brassicogethes aeneus TaxID=1431903 RepID=A0A9P0BFE5_BRAAE|nr:unnamed protein product [Brassicogethes aeneus]